MKSNLIKLLPFALLGAMVATICDANHVFTEALSYLDRCLDGGFRPGMGHVLPDRLFWAQPDNDDSGGADASSNLLNPHTAPHDTQH